jgi:predicted transcriptional regulator
MKSVMLSIRPKWCEKIVSGEKTIEVRKTKPKLETPFKCYIYCTQSGVALGAWGKHGKVIGEFTCDRIDRLAPANEPYGIYDIDDDYVLQTCLENGALWDYGHGTPLYGWHISNLRIYDQPRELSEFAGLRNTRFGAAPYDIKRPPQSWCYVEEWEKQNDA